MKKVHKSTRKRINKIINFASARRHNAPAASAVRSNLEDLSPEFLESRARFFARERAMEALVQEEEKEVVAVLMAGGAYHPHCLDSAFYASLLLADDEVLIDADIDLVSLYSLCETTSCMACGRRIPEWIAPAFIEEVPGVEEVIE